MLAVRFLICQLLFLGTCFLLAITPIVSSNRSLAQSNLQLTNGEFVEGDFAGLPADSSLPLDSFILWQSKEFDSPLKFQWKNVRSISTNHATVDPDDAFAFVHLRDEQMIVGQVIERSNALLKLNSKSLGNLEIPMSEVESIVPSNDKAIVIVHPSEMKHRFESLRI